MNAIPASGPCPFCGQADISLLADCPACHASAAWLDLMAAQQFADAQFEVWAKERITDAQATVAALAANTARRNLYLQLQNEGRVPPADSGLENRNLCWSCAGTILDQVDFCTDCGAPVDAQSLQSVRYWKYTCARIKALADGNVIPLYQAHACLNVSRGRLAGVQARLEKNRQVIVATAVDSEAVNEVERDRGNENVAGMVCCVLYAASARILRDSMFVYVLTAGVAMTGLLILADMHKFWEVASPAALLVALGIACLHTERAFADGDGPFSRRSFGMAFFWSGQALLAAGLMLLLGAQIAGDWLYKPFFESFYLHFHATPPAVVTERWGQLLALTLVCAAVYAYAYSDLVVRRIGVYIFLAVLSLLWAEALVIEIFAVTAIAEATIIALAFTSLLANLLAPATSQLKSAGGAMGGVGIQDSDAQQSLLRPLNRAALPLGLILSTLPIIIGTLLLLRATYSPLAAVWPQAGAAGQTYAIGWLYVAAMVLTAIACRVGGHVYRHVTAWLCPTYFFGTAAATLLAAAGLMSILGVRDWHQTAAMLMLIPIAYLVASRLYRGHTPENPLAWAAHASTTVIIATVLADTVEISPQALGPVTGSIVNLWLALIFAEAALFYGLATFIRKLAGTVYLATFMACGACWQLLLYGNVAPEWFPLVFAIVGLAILVGYRMAFWERTGISQAAFQCANALMSVSAVGMAMLALCRILAPLATLQWWLVELLAASVVINLFAAVLVRHAQWRRCYVILAIVEAILLAIAVHALIDLSIYQQTELFYVVAGLALLIVGHIGWRREDDSQQDIVSFNLVAGSIMMGLPLTIALIYHRFELRFSAVDECGILATAILLLATGFVFQLRATTMTGGGMLAIYLITMLLFINMIESVQKAAIWLTIGGGAIFGTGIILSIYRDRLLMLPDKVKRREGIFRVLGWR